MTVVKLIVMTTNLLVQVKSLFFKLLITEAAYYLYSCLITRKRILVCKYTILMW